MEEAPVDDQVKLQRELWKTLERNGITPRHPNRVLMTLAITVGTAIGIFSQKGNRRKALRLFLQIATLEMNKFPLKLVSSEDRSGS